MSDKMAAGTSVQVGLAGMGHDAAQVKMLEEFGTAPGTGGRKDTLIDADAIKRKEAARPLPGQVEFKTDNPKPLYKHTRKAQGLRGELYELDAEIQELSESIKNNPARDLVGLLTRSGDQRGELAYLTKKQYRKYLRREPSSTIVDKSGRIPWYYAIDELASERGAASDEELKRNVENLKRDMNRLSDLKAKRGTVRRNIKTVDTEAPKPDITKTVDGAPVFPKETLMPATVTEFNDTVVKTRRNPSFHQVEVDDLRTEKSPDLAVRVRYKHQAEKLTRAAITEERNRMGITKRRKTSITPRRRSIR